MPDIAQFRGESAWAAVVNHRALDIVEEATLVAYCEEHGVDVSDIAAVDAACNVCISADAPGGRLHR